MMAGIQNGIAAYPIHVRSEISVQFCEPHSTGVRRITHFDRDEVVMSQRVCSVKKSKSKKKVSSIVAM